VHEAVASFDIEKLDESLHRFRAPTNDAGGRTGYQLRENPSPDVRARVGRYRSVHPVSPGWCPDPGANLLVET
jgi:hypothetical protein